VLFSLKQLNAGNVIIVKHKPSIGTISYEEAQLRYSDAHIIINTSPVGMFPDLDKAPIDLSPYHHLEAVIDLIANPLETRLLKNASNKGIKSVGGLIMLVAQAKYASELFQNIIINDCEIENVYLQIKTLMEQP
jgi:shikimate dehydrogenase